MWQGMIERLHRGHRRFACVAALALSACSTSPEETPSTGGNQTSPLPRTAALISGPLAGPSADAAAIVLGQAYVSMVPGTEPGGDSVTIAHLHGVQSVGTRIIAGGFDPVAIEAEAGDTLAVTIHRVTGVTTTSYGYVPMRGRPTVVRTSAASVTDVPLNYLITVVFSEPMDSSSLSGAVHLQLQGVEVPGTVTAMAAGGVILSGEFRPASPLEPGTTYRLAISTEAQDVSGIPLAAPVEVSFTTTGTTPEPTPAPQISAISPTSAMPGAPDLTLTITGTNFVDSQAVSWLANGTLTALATTFVSSTQLTALVPASLLSHSGTIQVFLYRPVRSNMVTFLVLSPPPPLGQSTIIVEGELSGYPAPIGFLGWRDLSLDGSPLQTLREGGSVMFSPVAPGKHQLVLSNPCTSTHQPSSQGVTAVADQIITVRVYVPPDCE